MCFIRVKSAGHCTVCEKSKELSKISIQMFYVLWVELPQVRSDLYLQKYILKTKNLNSIIYVSLEELRMNNMQQKKCYWNVCNLEQVMLSHPSLSESALVFLILTTCFFGGMMANFDIILYIIARENVFHPCKIGQASYGVRLISNNAVRAPYGARPGIGRWCHIQKPAAARTICDHAREIS